MIIDNIKELVEYAVEKGLIEKEDSIYAANQLMEVLKVDDYNLEGQNVSIKETNRKIEEILDEINDYAYEKKLIAENGPVYRDLFDTKIMGCLTPLPSTIIKIFREYYEVLPKKATDYFYELSKASNYIRTERVNKDLKWKTSTEYGELDITINLSKPEKDPKAIAAAKNAVQSGYPKCLLCKENEGYAGRINYPARQNHRVIPIVLNGNEWGLQYSPYVYYNEHCIVFNGEHIPMTINRETFSKLLDFIEQFPHYFIGSNADLPIVGGSILSHDHFQGGQYRFAMEMAPVERTFQIRRFKEVKAGIVKWPMSVIRIASLHKEKLVEAADHILNIWRGYSDEEAFIFAKTDQELHNTITPIARMKDGMYELDLVLRNNITTKEHPLGVYHPHNNLHHIKKENIGLIEVMGLAVLPARLKHEMEALADLIIIKQDFSNNQELAKHKEWVDELLTHYTKIDKENIMNILQEEIGKVFTRVLEDAGVFKRDKNGMGYFRKFTDSL